MSDHLKFIDLFAGIGGMRQGLEDACQKMGISAKCVFTSEIGVFSAYYLFERIISFHITVSS